MNRTRFARVLTTVALSAALLALPLNAFAARHAGSAQRACKTKLKLHSMTTSGGPVITFGIEGGNIQPWSVTFAGGGQVNVTGWVKPRTAHLTDPVNTLNGLIKLADVEGFFSKPALTRCTGTLPDIAGHYVRIYTSSGSHRAELHGGCSTSFNQLYAALQNAAGIGT